MGMNVTLNDNSEEVLNEFSKNITTALEEIGLIAEGYAKQYCPVDTGRLRNSISHDKDSDSAYIGTNVEYASYVEMGTSRQKAQPYLQPAVTNHIDEYKKIAEEKMKDN